MKLSEAKVKFEEHYFDSVEIRVSPGNMDNYFAMLYGRDGKLFMLCNEDESVVSLEDIGQLVVMLKELGCKELKLYLTV